MKVEYYPTFPVKHRAEIANLTVPGRLWHRYMRDGQLSYLTDVSLVWLDKKIISWAAVTLYDGYNEEYWIGCYTRPEYRRQGYGAAAVENTLSRTSHKKLVYCDSFFEPLINKHQQAA